MLKLTLKDGAVVECDSVDDLARFYRQLPVNGANGHRKTRELPKKSANAENHTTFKPMPDAPLKFVSLLFGAPEGIDSGNVVKLLQVTPRSLGGTVTSLAAWGRQYNLAKNQMIVKARRPNGNGHTVRTLALTENFRKMIKEGKVPGVKLDT